MFMPQWIAPLSSSLPERLAGRKAAALSRLLAHGFPVPAGWCITTEAFDAAAAASRAEVHLPDGLLEVLTAAIPANTPLAVRSSAVLEDMPAASLAGLYATSLNVIGAAALERAVLDCWRSYLNAPDTIKRGGMSILLQPMLDAECAGVCFSVDPVRHRPDLLLVVAGWGLGAGVVSGTAPVDTIRLRRTDLAIEEQSLADKRTAIRPATSGDGVATVSVPDEQRSISCLPDSWLQRVGQFALAIEQVFEAPQDVEWAISGGHLWILQSRPVTALSEEVRSAARYPVGWENGEEPRHYWWLERARDSSGTPLLPAELDFMHINTHGGQDAVYLGGYSQTRWRKHANGRVYMAAARSPNSPGHVRMYSAALQEFYKRLRQQEVTPWEHWGPEIVRATLRLAAFEAHAADGFTLAEHLEDVVAAARRHWMVHTLSPRPIRSAELLEAYARLTGLQEGEAAPEIPFLLSGAETVQARLVEALYGLASLALEAPEEAEAIVLGTAGGKPGSPGMEAFTEAFRQLIAGYGDRLCYQPIPGFPVMVPLPWREAPQHIWGLIAAYLPLARQSGRGGSGPRESRREAKRAADQRVESLCEAAHEGGVEPELVEAFRRTLAYARRSAASLDEQNHYIDQVSEGQYTQALLHAGRWLEAQGCLPSPFDVFWLTIDEVLAALREPPAGIEKLLGARRAQYAEWQAMIPPACLGLPDAGLPERPVNPPQARIDKASGAALPPKTLTGEPASRGKAEGRARLIGGEAPPVDIAPGDVLVAPFASLSLIPALPAAAAVVLDGGSPGDHFAITAREFGLPAVCGTGKATHSIPEGARVIVDANSGLVSWE